MLNKRLGVVLLCVVLVLSAALAAPFFMGSGEKEPEANYSKLFSEVELRDRDEGIGGFVIVEPKKASYHIGDVITVRFGLVYEGAKWEVSEEQFRTNTPLPNRFEVKSRKVNVAIQGGLKLIEISLVVQCLECRDIKECVGPDYEHPRFHARNKDTGEIKSISSPVKYINFSSLTDEGDDIDFDLLRIPVQSQNRSHFYLWSGVILSLIIAVSILIYSRRQKIFFARRRDRENNHQAYLERLNSLLIESGERSTVGVADATYNLLSLFAQEHGDERNSAGEILNALEQSYSKDGISREVLCGIIKKARDYISGRGEV